jgi:hypothetical protein
LLITDDLDVGRWERCPIFVTFLQTKISVEQKLLFKRVTVENQWDFGQLQRKILGMTMFWEALLGCKVQGFSMDSNFHMQVHWWWLFTSVGRNRNVFKKRILKCSRTRGNRNSSWYSGLKTPIMSHYRHCVSNQCWQFNTGVPESQV